MSSALARIVIAVAFGAVVFIHFIAPHVGVSATSQPQRDNGGARLIPPPPGMVR